MQWQFGLNGFDTNVDAIINGEYDYEYDSRDYYSSLDDDYDYDSYYYLD